MDKCDDRGSWEWCRLFLQITILLLTVVGNSLVILSICFVKILHHPRNYLIVSLAVADLLVGVTIIPFKISLTEACHIWKDESVLCYIGVSGDVVLCTASIFGLTAISIDRYFAIRKPLFHKVTFTAATIYILIGLTWILAVIPIVFYWALATFQPKEKLGYSSFGVCVQDQQSAWFQIVCVLYAFFGPLIILIFVTGTIVRILKQQDSKFREMGVVLKTEMIGLEESKSTCSVTFYRFLEERKGCIMTGIVVLAFVICWLPFFSLMLIDALFRIHGKDFAAAPWLVDAIVWPGYFNSCVNPFIYTMFNKDFRFALNEFICCRCSSVNFRQRSEIYTEQMRSSIVKAPSHASMLTKSNMAVNQVQSSSN